MVSATMGAASSARPKFYVWMAGIFILIAFGGFIPTYWAKMAAGTFGGAPILHIHGTLFFSWTLFFFAQTWMVANGRILDHRNWGIAGVSLATAMAITVVLAVINSIKVAETIGMADEARRFSIVSLSAVVEFAVIFTLAIYKSNRAETHKRLMVLATIPLMEAALARVFMTLFSPPGAIGPPPVMVGTPPGLVVDLLLVAGMVYDWRTRGRPHPVYLIGLPLMVATQIVRVPLSPTDAWMSVTRWVEALTG